MFSICKGHLPEADFLDYVHAVHYRNLITAVMPELKLFKDWGKTIDFFIS